MTLFADIQKLEPGAHVELFEGDGTSIGVGILRFHGYTQVGSIFWQSNEYFPWPIEAEGWARTGDRPPNPVLRVGNINGAITSLILQSEGLSGMRIVRRRTLGKYLDAINFPEGNSTADPTQEFPPELWFIERKISETKEVVEFELASAMDLNGIKLPRRQIIANFCNWIVIGGYRGPYCGYTGPPVALPDDTPTSDPLLDDCGGRVSSCKLRFGANKPLPFGGFPGASIVRTS